MVHYLLPPTNPTCLRHPQSEPKGPRTLIQRVAHARAADVEKWHAHSALQIAGYLFTPQKCDRRHPVCGQCEKGGRSDDCEYIDGEGLSTVQILEDNIIRLEARIRELQGTSGPVELHHPYMNSVAPTNEGTTPERTMAARSNIADPPKHIAQAL